MRDRKAYFAAYYAANREKITARRKEHYRANTEKVLERNRCYKELNRDAIRRHQAVRRAANRDHLRRYGHRHNLRVQYLRNLNRWVDRQLKEIE